MARPLRVEYPDAFYHVTSRGNEPQDIVRSRRDRERFLEDLESATVRYGACIHVYCLMSNHYHLLVETPEGNLSQIMRHLNGAYTNYFTRSGGVAGTCSKAGTKPSWCRVTNMLWSTAVQERMT